MKNAITLTGHVLVSDMIDALEPMLPADLLTSVDDAVGSSRKDERVNFDDCEVLIEEALDTLDDADKLPEPEGLEDQIDQSTLISLAEAIRCGETARAEEMLDRLFADSSSYASSIREWIDRGRFSSKARAAKAANTRSPRGHTATEYRERNAA